MLRRGKKLGTAIVGGVVCLVGLVLIPYPGPGWLIVFAGFAILSTEFAFAAKALQWLKCKYERWSAWLKLQPLFVRIVALGFTGLVVLITIWLINTFGLIDTLFHFNQPWLHSPFFRY